MHKNTHHTIPRKKNYIFLSTHFSFSSTESAKLHTLRAYVPTCQRALWAYVLMFQRAIRAYVLTRQRTLRAYVLTCKRVLRAYVSTCLTCFPCSRANVPCVLCVPMCLRVITTNNKKVFKNMFSLHYCVCSLFFSCKIKLLYILAFLSSGGSL